MAENQISNMKLGGYSVSDIRDTASEYVSNFQGQYADVDRRVRNFVHQQPLVAVAGAFAVGFLLARSIRAWRRW
ncbi:MAG TPA: hypothetical protein VFV50_16055 [Bdellovibrionales bacterium]|nr:hypothetical protein [Bdellovibrionales bacterium]